MSKRWPAVALTLAVALAGCDTDPGEAPDSGPPETPCGTGEVSIELGVDNPFVAAPDHAFPIEQGLQGGYHIDISLRTQGTLDPDHVDLQLDLYDGDLRIARHLTTDWLLHILPEGPWCDYPRARLVLVDGEGGLLPADRVEGLVGRALRFETYLRTPLGDADGAFEVTPSEVRLLR